jgi:hypothetical protein
MASADKNGIVWPDSGQGEKEIRILNSELFLSSPWLREKRFSGSYQNLISRFSGLRIAAVSIRPNGSHEKGRCWYLRSTDNFTLPCPVEAVVPNSVAANSISTPFFTGVNEAFRKSENQNTFNG